MRVQCKSSCWQMFFKIGVRPETLLKRLQHRCFPFSTPFLQNTSTLIAASGSKQCKPMKIYTERLSCRKKKWYPWTVLLSLVFKIMNIHLRFSKHCWQYPHFSNVEQKIPEALVQRCFVKKMFWKFRKPKVFSWELCEIFKNAFFVEHLR